MGEIRKTSLNVDNEGDEYLFVQDILTELLDKMIIDWRRIRDEGDPNRPDLTDKNHAGYCPADCYVDAYQCVRKAICGEILD